ncbi:MAG: HK97 family phage prohead protease [Caldilineaceae bacterium]
MQLERRFTTSELRAEGEGRTITGYAAVFNSLSQVLWGFREKIAPGAFAEALGDDVRALWNHDTGIVLGRTISGTLRLHEDEKGLRVEIDPPESAVAQVESIRRGDVNQMSFGFNTLEDTWDEDEDGQIIRTLKKVKLFEVSPVVFPAYTATSVGVRSDEIYGVIPEIPAELRRASSSATDELSQARARLRKRQRLLDLLSI